MKVASTVLEPIVRNNLRDIQETQPYVYNWLIESAKRIGMHPKKLQLKLLELFQTMYFEFDMTSKTNRIIRN